MPFLISLALGWKWPAYAARLFGWTVPLLAVAALTGAMIALVYHHGETAGGARLQAKTDAAHDKAVADAREDERKAQAVTDAIDHRVATADDQTTTLVRSKLTEIHDDLSSTSGAPAGGDAAARVFDDSGVRASLNALVDDANRAAEAADAER